MQKYVDWPIWPSINKEEWYRQITYLNPQQRQASNTADWSSNPCFHVLPHLGLYHCNCFPVELNQKNPAFKQDPGTFILTCFFRSSYVTFSGISWIDITGPSAWLDWRFTPATTLALIFGLVWTLGEERVGVPNPIETAYYNVRIRKNFNKRQSGEGNNKAVKLTMKVPVHGQAYRSSFMPIFHRFRIFLKYLIHSAIVYYHENSVCFWLFSYVIHLVHDYLIRCAVFYCACQNQSNWSFDLLQIICQIVIQAKRLSDCFSISSFCKLHHFVAIFLRFFINRETENLHSCAKLGVWNNWQFHHVCDVTCTR